jgi:hypothetical protein
VQYLNKLLICCNFYSCLHPINLIFFFRSSVQDYQKLFLSSVVLGTKELNIGYNNAMSFYFNRKGNLSSAYGNYKCHYLFLKLFAFQIRTSNAVVVPVHHSSFGPSTHIFLHQFLRVMQLWLDSFLCGLPHQVGVTLVNLIYFFK